MTDFLLFTLYGPLSSWGEIAVGESRGSWDRPSRSAVLGIIGAAMGLTREAQSDHDALDEGYGMAVRLNAPGTPLVDYHTAQTVPASVARKHVGATRAELLNAGAPETILSRRSYRQDAIATVAIWAREGAVWPLAELAAALQEPAFALYAGRKANPLGLPLAPEVVRTATLAAAFEHRDAGHGVRADASPAARETINRVLRALRPRDGWGREVAHDPMEEGATGLIPLRREVRRDAAVHRGRWQFAERDVEMGQLPAASSTEGGT